MGENIGSLVLFRISSNLDVLSFNLELLTVKTLTRPVRVLPEPELEKAS